MFFQTLEEEENFYQRGGPRNFYKYRVQGLTVILIGEIHKSISSSLVKPYLEAFIDFIKQCESATLFLELPPENTNTPFSEFTFIDHLSKLNFLNNLNIINAD